ncbi:MAG: DUF4922 domain-containing protein [Bacteroidota bacterium]|jgi:hypothetical protein|nr:DUF4922 domain-containing protein [Ignavibacteria bacterium]MCU7500101.1 DUF4922 domain-containing protein [Ignavibacteria bacterium]MCU7513832.1 DUF4922 domain-containing protein [Ignavibacteria bacterium]MCU7520833.1 DUF4922 domain-containing protein [Ignavibacteria bacterium]MCU7525266.1 DUF4922 domain-containing protein [Ignavibacteria bacterium]
MRDTTVIKDSELEPYISSDDLAGKAKALLAQQKESWELLSKGYNSLNNVEVKTFEFDHFKIKVQFNPGRITSSAAKVDEKSIKERKCFLCPDNLPEAQKGILYKEDYIVLCNPFPIFNEHFTLPRTSHVPQEIKSSFPELLSFTKDLSRYYTVFYNGPKCGASAPDHLHFQAGDKAFMPIDSEYTEIKENLGRKIVDCNDLQVYAVDRYPGKFLSFESSNPEALTEGFNHFYGIFKEVSNNGAEEPMMNILSFYDNGKWHVMVFPRAKHRPSYFFMEGDDNILLSPASVDMGGVLITPLEKDFKKITRENIVDIFRQVTLSDETFEYISGKLAQIYS